MEKKVLIVDDEEQIREMLVKAFNLKGFEVTSAASAEEALEILKKSNIQVMFLDLKLPGMDGLELCRRIRRENPIACLFAMTGYSGAFELFNCREAGFDDYFLKPLDLRLVLKTAEDSFDKLERWKKK